MIIEFFGPPASGKTTLAVSLAERLRASGFKVRRKLSARPGEESLVPFQKGSRISHAPMSAPARRLLRPAYELILAATRSSADRLDNHCTDFLARGSARGRTLRFLRTKQYLMRLSRSWREATESDDVWIFDQAYVQVIATIMVQQPHLTDADLLAMLDVAPKPDLVVFVEAPVAEVEMRLGRRKRFVGLLGRLFEEDLGEVRGQAQAAARLHMLLTRSGRQVVTVDSSDGAPLDVPVEGVQHAISRMPLVCGTVGV